MPTICDREGNVAKETAWSSRRRGVIVTVTVVWIDAGLPPGRRNPGSPDDVRLRRHRETHDRSWPPSQSSRTPAAKGTRHLVTARAEPARLQANDHNEA